MNKLIRITLSATLLAGAGAAHGSDFIHQAAAGARFTPPPHCRGADGNSSMRWDQLDWSLDELRIGLPAGQIRLAISSAPRGKLAGPDFSIGAQPADAARTPARHNRLFRKHLK